MALFLHFKSVGFILSWLSWNLYKQSGMLWLIIEQYFDHQCIANNRYNTMRPQNKNKKRGRLQLQKAKNIVVSRTDGQSGTQS